MLEVEDEVGFPGDEDAGNFEDCGRVCSDPIPADLYRGLLRRKGPPVSGQVFFKNLCHQRFRKPDFKKQEITRWHAFGLMHKNLQSSQ